jgi:hypothetical protein
MCVARLLYNEGSMTYVTNVLFVMDVALLESTGCDSNIQSNRAVPSNIVTTSLLTTPSCSALYDKSLDMLSHTIKRSVHKVDCRDNLVHLISDDVAVRGTRQQPC